MHTFHSSYPLLLNADVGEGFAHDNAIIDIVDIANIACGAHAGSRDTILETLDSVQHFNKYAFAHLGYEDKANFGRKSLHMDEQAFAESIHKQLDTLFSAANEANAVIYGIKPHGALYHDASTNNTIAQQLIESCMHYQSLFFEEQLIVIAQAHSAFYNSVRQAGLSTLAEAFIDRRYGADKQLLPRTLSEATIAEPDIAAEQAYKLSYHHIATSLDGYNINISADTLCLHGDSNSALTIAQAVAKRLRSNTTSYQ